MTSYDVLGLEPTSGIALVRIGGRELLYLPPYTEQPIAFEDSAMFSRVVSGLELQPQNVSVDSEADLLAYLRATVRFDAALSDRDLSSETLLAEASQILSDEDFLRLAIECRHAQDLKASFDLLFFARSRPRAPEVALFLTESAQALALEMRSWFLPDLDEAATETIDSDWRPPALFFGTYLESQSG